MGLIGLRKRSESANSVTLVHSSYDISTVGIADAIDSANALD